MRSCLARWASRRRISCCVRVKSVKPSTTTSSRLSQSGARIGGEGVAGGEVAALGVAQRVGFEQPLVFGIEQGQFTVFGCAVASSRLLLA